MVVVMVTVMVLVLVMGDGCYVNADSDDAGDVVDNGDGHGVAILSWGEASVVVTEVCHPSGLYQKI